MRVDLSASGDVPFRPHDFGIVGIFDIDWISRPAFTTMLDTFAASPGAVSGVRVFGVFTAGQPDLFTPDTSGTVWTEVSHPIDLSRTFDALEALATRGLVPFIVLGFFPPAVSNLPIQPPGRWGEWKTLVRTFLLQLAADPRFGAQRIEHWWFEVWNEPNEGRFWLGTPDDYLALYRATSEAVDSTGLKIRLGGPAIAYKPEVDPVAGQPWMERFLRYIAADPSLRCEFISLHRKGTVTDDPPNPRRLYDAATQTAKLAMDIDPVRFADIVIINNEADEKVGFEVPYAPRMDHRAASWLGATTALHASLETTLQDSGVRFMAAADNANLQLVRAPFDGRRSVLTLAPLAGTALLKLPVYNFYEILRMLGDRRLAITSGEDHLFPETDLYHLATASDAHVASLITHYPDPAELAPTRQTLKYVVDGLAWARINVASFLIDRLHSNSYTAAGGSPENPFPVPEPSALPSIRSAQELAVAHPIRRGVRVIAGRHEETLELEPYATLCLWITPEQPDVPAPPAWFEIEAEPERTTLRWQPSQELHFYSYEVFDMEGDKTMERLSPEPLRSAMWTDPAPVAPMQAYGVRVVSAAGVASSLIVRTAMHRLSKRA